MRIGQYCCAETEHCYADRQHCYAERQHCYAEGEHCRADVQHCYTEGAALLRGDGGLLHAALGRVHPLRSTATWESGHAPHRADLAVYTAYHAVLAQTLAKRVRKSKSKPAPDAASSVRPAPEKAFAGDIFVIDDYSKEQVTALVQ